MVIYCSKYSHCKLVREFKLQSLRRKEIFAVTVFLIWGLSKKINKNLKQPRLWKCIMLPAHVSPVKYDTSAAMNGSKDNTSRLKWLFRGLHSVFAPQLDHPLGPLLLVYRHWHTYSKAHTLCVWLFQHRDPLLSAPRQLCSHGSSGNSCLLWLVWRRTKGASQHTPVHTLWPADVLLGRKEPLNNTWNESWIS